MNLALAILLGVALAGCSLFSSQPVHTAPPPPVASAPAVAPAMRDSSQKLAADVTKVSGEVQRSVTDVRDTIRQMAGDVTSTSTDLDKVQRRLAGTSNSLNGTSG